MIMNFKNKKVLITGGTGFLATNLVKYLLKNGCEYIRLTSRDEVKQAKMFEYFNKDSRLNYILADVTNYRLTEYSLKDIDICIHTAASKRIDAGERNPFHFVETNIIGTKNVIDACLKNNVEKAVFISTDKACQPISIYGSSKFAAEKLWIYANNYSGASGTEFTAVRYGNVWKSTGSIYHIFKQQLESKQGYFTITHPEMTRFFMTVNDAINTIMYALDNTRGNGEVFVPKVPSFKVVDLARAFSEEFFLKVIGLRGIEKVHETLVSKEEMASSIEKDGYYVLLPYRPIHLNRWKHDIKPWDECRPYTSDTNTEWLTITGLKDVITRDS